MTTATKKTTSQPKAKTVAAPNPGINENVRKGTVYSLGAIIVGIVLWVILWRMGFIASIAAFAIAWAAIKLYGFGAGVVTRTSAPIIVGVSVVGVVLAFLAGMASDGLDFFTSETHLSYSEALTSGGFWSFFWANLQSSELWSSYRNDILMSLLFAGLGMFWTLKDLFIMPSVSPVSAPPKKNA